MATAPDVTSALDDTGRRFAFRPAAILGNSSLLATISERGEIERLFWPNVDHGQHLGELRLGLERDGTIAWLDDAPCSWEQSYADGSSVLRTTADLEGTTVVITDLVTPAEPVLVRGIRSTSATRLVVRIAPSLDGDERSGAGYVDPGSGALVFYLRGVALAVALIAQDT
jgi:glucoamylase